MLYVGVVNPYLINGFGQSTIAQGFVIMVVKENGVKKPKDWISSLGGLKVVVSTLLLISALLIYWVLAQTNSVSPSVVIISNTQQNNINQASVAALPAPAKKLTKLLDQSINTSQIENDSGLDQAITKANHTIDSLDQQLVALGYQPDIANNLRETNFSNIDDTVNKSDSAVIERFEKLKAIIQQ